MHNKTWFMNTNIDILSKIEQFDWYCQDRTKTDFSKLTTHLISLIIWMHVHFWNYHYIWQKTGWNRKDFVGNTKILLSQKLYLFYGLKDGSSVPLWLWLLDSPPLCSESPHSEPGALDEVDNGTGPNTSDEGESPNTNCRCTCKS